MKCLWREIDLGWTCLGDIHRMTTQAIQIANMLDTRCKFEFNGIVVNVHKNSKADDVASKALDCVTTGEDYYDLERG